jgi:hypothetical protein
MLAVAREGGVVIVDAVTGAVLADLTLEAGTGVGGLMFGPDGTSLALGVDVYATERPQVRVWSLTRR